MSTEDIKMQFTERLDKQRCMNVLAMSQKDFKKTFFTKDDDLQWDTYYSQCRAYIRSALSKNGAVKRTYAYSKHNKMGRRYVQGGIGLQTMQSKLRNYLCGTIYYDLDMVNCHPRLLAWVCKEHDIVCPLLDQYVAKRDDCLKSHEVTKLDMLIVMNTDEIKEKRKNPYLTAFAYEQQTIKKELCAKMDLKLDKGNNPMSSAMSRMLCKMENQILGEAMEFFKNGYGSDVPMFDGWYIQKSVFNNDDAQMKQGLKKLNDSMDETFNGYVQFVCKSTDTGVELPESKGFQEYADVKEKFEETYFQTMYPFCFWKSVLNSDGMVEYRQLRIGEFQIECKQFPIIDYKGNGDQFETDIFERWICDTTRRKYECTDFFPYGKYTKCPSHVFNTFNGFLITKKPVPCDYREVDIGDFCTLVRNLCGNDLKMTEYMIKYIAQMFQHPDVVTEIIVVFKSWPGCGKDSLVRTLQALMGTRHVATTGDPQHLFGNFNGILENKIAMFMNELQGRHGIEYEENMKCLSTSQHNIINNKHDKTITQKNCVRLFINSNANGGGVNIQANDRRYVVCQSTTDLVIRQADKEKSRKAEEYWDRYYKNLQDYNWQRSLYEFLMSRDLTDFDPRKTPKSELREAMREKNIPALHLYMKLLMETRTHCDKGYKYENFVPYELAKNCKRPGKVHLIKPREFLQLYNDFLENDLQAEYKIKSSKLKELLIDQLGDGFEGQKCVVAEHGVQQRYLAFRMDKIEAMLANFVFTEKDDMIEMTEALKAAVVAPRFKPSTVDPRL